tara:strand:+ start:7965 stop:8249 length:285 start_codon:yes stop_codon:yes gene_type:complete
MTAKEIADALGGKIHAPALPASKFMRLLDGPEDPAELGPAIEQSEHDYSPLPPKVGYLMNHCFDCGRPAPYGYRIAICTNCRTERGRRFDSGET